MCRMEFPDKDNTYEKIKKSGENLKKKERKKSRQIESESIYVIEFLVFIVEWIKTFSKKICPVPTHHIISFNVNHKIIDFQT